MTLYKNILLHNTYCCLFIYFHGKTKAIKNFHSYWSHAWECTGKTPRCPKIWPVLGE